MTKSDIVDVLEDIAVLLELKGENAFKVRAYQSGARALEALDDDLDTVISEGRLGGIKGIGKALQDKIVTLHQTGALEYYEKLRNSVPFGLIEMLDIPGVGPKKIRKLNQELGIESVADLKAACEAGKVAGLAGFGAKTEEKILSGIQNREAYGRRHLWWSAEAVVEPLLEGLRALPQVEKVEAAGSFRRCLETVGDLDFIVGSDDPAPIMDWFTSRPNVAEVSAKGETKSSVRFEGGMQADLRVVPPSQFFFALHHFTGSKDHNVLMRGRALERGLSLSEWGLAPKDEAGKMDAGKSLKIGSEADLFKALDLRFIPPELREGRDEIEAAEQGDLPRLIESGDLQGVFHNHTNASDGRNTLEEMIQAAEDMGWEYVGLGDHSKASFQANGLDEERVLAQLEAVERLRQSGKFRIHVFSGIECDILPDGRLDLEDSVLAKLDYVVSSVHSAMSQGEEEMTRRLIRAIEHPATCILGHLTGRLLLRREGYGVNVSKIIDAAVANNVAIELNANPHRLDMDWRFWKRAAEKGVLCAINPDAHSAEGFQYTRAGVLVARKGWLTRENVLNTRSRDEIQRWLDQRSS